MVCSAGRIIQPATDIDPLLGAKRTRFKIFAGDSPASANLPDRGRPDPPPQWASANSTPTGRPERDLLMQTRSAARNSQPMTLERRAGATVAR